MEHKTQLSWQRIKDLIFAPFLEELIYRGVIFGLFRDCGTFSESPTQCLILLPLFFAFAHIHALWRKAFELERNELRVEILLSIFKVVYTQIFGFYSAYVYTATGSLWAAIILHSHCNYFGFPNFGSVTNTAYSFQRRVLFAIAYSVGVVLFILFRPNII